MDQRAALRPAVGILRPERDRCGLRHEQGDDRRRRGHHRGRDPDGRVITSREDRLAQERPEGQTEVDRQRPDVDRLATPLGRCHVADGRDCRHEEERITDTEDRARDDEHRQCRDEQVQHEGRDGQRAAEDEQRSPSEPVRRPAHHRAQGQRGDREDADRDTHTRRVGAERACREPGRHRQHRVAGGEEPERGDPEDDERPAEQRWADRGRPLRHASTRAIASRRRSAAAYGSTRCSATSSMTLSATAVSAVSRRRSASRSAITARI